MNNNNPLKILSWNANGIRNKLNELQALLSKTKIDIILICETKLNPHTQLKFKNYHIYRTDNTPRPGTPAHGGTAIFVHRRIIHRHIHLATTMPSTSIEISIGHDLIQISAIYKSPNNQLLTSDLDLITHGNEWFIAAGDLNAKHPLWNSRCANTAGNILYHHVTQSDYSILSPDSPTFFPSIPHHRPDVLDIALVKLPSQSIQITNLNELSSDHNPLLLNITDSPISSNPPIPSRRINWKKFTTLLDQQFQTQNPTINTKQEIDEAIDFLTSKTLSTLEKSSSTITRKKTNLTLPPEIAYEITEKNRIRRQWQRFRDPATKRLLNEKIKFIRQILTTHRHDEWDKFIDSVSSNLNSIYKLNKQLLNKTPASHPLNGPNGPVYNASEKAEMFADTYQTQFTPNPGQDLPEVTSDIQLIHSSPSQNTYFTSPGTLQYLINKLPKRKAPGEDSITNTALKNYPTKVLLFLTKIINGCLRTGYFPDSWKRAIIIAIPKPGKDLKLPSNHRPIALLSSLSKLYERIILHELKNAIGHKIRQEQFAFRKDHSTTLQLVKLTDLLSRNLNNKLSTASIFLDVEKAFDRVWHDGLLHKIIQIGTPIHLAKILSSFLQNRKFRVRIENQLSSSRPVQAGVPQGSCLSPLLYLIFTNDIPLTPKSNLSLFADDTMFFTTDKNPKRASIQLQHQLNIASNWFDKWRLHINTSKTVAILFSHHNNHPDKLIISGQQIPWTTSAKYLGITLDRRLSFNPHIKNTILKANRIRRSLYPVLNRRSPVPIHIKLLITQLYIRSSTTYGGQAWGPLISKSNWSRIETTQNTCFRIITASPFYVTTKTLQSTLNSTSLQDFIKKLSKSLFYKNQFSNQSHIRNLGLSIPSSPPLLSKPYILPYNWSNL